MAKRNDETLFEIPMDTEDIDVSDEISLRMPATSGTPKQSSQANPAGGAPNLQEIMLSGEMPQLLAVDIAPGEIPKSNSIVQENIPEEGELSAGTLPATETEKRLRNIPKFVP